MNFDLILLRQAAKEAKDTGTPIAREAIDRVIDDIELGSKMSGWRATLERAATLSLESVRQLPPFIRLLEAVIAKRATVDDVRSELGTIVERRPGFLEALDAALSSGRRGSGLAAARAVLFELPRVIDAIVSIPPLGPEPDTEGGLAQTVERMHTRERGRSEVAKHPTLACPRCGSRRIETQHTDAFGRREIEVRCAECGNYGAWTDGDADEGAWHPVARRVALSTPTELTDIYIEYLRTGAAEPRKLALALCAAGFDLEGALLEHEGWRTDDWGRVFVGRKPPDDAGAGDVWLDTVEVMPMVLVEEPTYRDDRPTRPVWLAIRPVTRWQFRGFAAAAPIVERPVQFALQVSMLDSARLAGNEMAPMTSILEAEAELYALWFGKVCGTRDAWMGARHSLGDCAEMLWVPGLREWTAELCSFDEGLRARIGPAEIELSPDDDYVAMRDDDAELRELVGEATHEPTTGFRTVAGSKLLTVFSETFRPFIPITIDHVYRR